MSTKYIINGKSMTEAEHEAWRHANRAHLDDRLQEMFSSGRGPYLQTDSVYLEGVDNEDFYQKRLARQHGVAVTGKRYISQLARFPGDPQAFVSGRGDIQKICEQRGWGCEGAVKVKKQGPKKEPVFGGNDVADDILNEQVDKIVAQEPAAKRHLVDRRELKEQVRDKLKPRKKK